MSYKVGHCAQCEIQIMVRDSDGQWNSFKTNHKQIDVRFEDGHLMRVAVCAGCAASPDYAGIMAAVIHDESPACSQSIKDELKLRGVPVDHKETRI